MVEPRNLGLLELTPHELGLLLRLPPVVKVIDWSRDFMRNDGPLVVKLEGPGLPLVGHAEAVPLVDIVDIPVATPPGQPPSPPRRVIKRRNES